MGKALFRTVKPLILASGSPRRRDYLHGLGLSFAVRPSHVDERVLPGEQPEAFVRRVSADKARALAEAEGEAWILAADTSVALDGKIMGKPENRQQALDMLLALSGRCHEVWTGFSLLCRAESVDFGGAVCTRVTFAPFPEPVLAAYVATGDPMDKAGAYGIQSLGAFLVSEIRGSYSNVVGLPLAETVSALTSHGVIAPL